MTSRYSVIQYVPDSIADERVNIGVMAYGEGAMFVRSLQDWHRVRCFSGHDPVFLREFLVRLQESTQPFQLGREGTALTSEQIEVMAREWANSIQLTPPRASLKSPHDLIEELVTTFLKHTEPKQQPYRTHEDAVALLRTRVRDVLQRRLSSENAEKLLRSRHRVDGRREPHEWDVVVANGTPYFAADAISFEMARVGPMRRMIDATAYKLIDVRELNPTFPIAVLALPPRTGGRAAEQYERAHRIFESVEARVLSENDFPGWAENQARRLPAEITA
jgi:hypothetical protein